MLEGQLRPCWCQYGIPLTKELPPGPLKRTTLHPSLSVGIQGAGFEAFIGIIQKLVCVITQEQHVLLQQYVNRFGSSGESDWKENRRPIMTSGPDIRIIQKEKLCQYLLLLPASDHYHQQKYDTRHRVFYEP